MPGPLASSALGFLTDFSADGLPATKLIVGVCIVVYGLMMATDAGRISRSSMPGLMQFDPSTSLRFGALVGPPLIVSEPWRVLSAVFLHASVMHIAMNMLSLVNLGRTMESHFRTARFVLIYLLSGALGFCASVWWKGEATFSVGASGAIFGLLGSFIGVLIVRRNPGWQNVLMSNLIMAVMIGYVFQRVDNAAHFGGFATGVGLGLLFELERQPRRRDRLVSALAAVGGLAVVASIVLSALSPAWKEQRQAEIEWTERHERTGQDSE
jgi:membrane associated rhomboid family serine protease